MVLRDRDNPLNIFNFNYYLSDPLVNTICHTINKKKYIEKNALNDSAHYRNNLTIRKYKINLSRFHIIIIIIIINAVAWYELLIIL